MPDQQSRTDPIFPIPNYRFLNSINCDQLVSRLSLLGGATGTMTTAGSGAAAARGSSSAAAQGIDGKAAGSGIKAAQALSSPGPQELKKQAERAAEQTHHESASEKALAAIGKRVAP